MQQEPRISQDSGDPLDWRLWIDENTDTLNSFHTDVNKYHKEFVYSALFTGPCINILHGRLLNRNEKMFVCNPTKLYEFHHR